MPSIDERVVSMAFENAKFEAGVAQTMRSLAKLDTLLQQIGSKNSLGDIEKAANKVTLDQPVKALDKLKARFSRAGDGASQGMNDIERAGNKVTLEQPIRALDKVQLKTAQVGVNAADGFNEIERASGRVGLQGLNSALDSVTAKFSTLQAAAAVALGGIAQQAAAKGASFAKSFAFGPIQQGFGEYQTNLGSIQTIMANTEGQRVSGLDETNKHLAVLNKYSDQTIYNFSQMAKNIGTFTAAGVDLDTATNSIKGISNLAALSGSSAEQASTAMYQLSQAISSGRVGLQDWNSVVNAGMGGRKFQNSLIQTGVAMGTIDAAAVKIDKSTGKATINGQSFRESIMARPGQKSWLTSEVLTGSLEQFTGDLSAAELKARGFTDAQIKSIQATAKTAKDAATQVKTLPQAFDVAKETIGSGWAQTFSLVFGDFKQSKKTFTEFSNTLNGFINNAAKARNKVLGEWKKLGGRDVLIQGIKQAFHDLLDILKPIHEAFRDIFPSKTGKELFDMTKGFADLMKRLQPSAATVDGLKRTFRGLFAVLHIGWSIVKGVVGVIGDLLGVVGHGSGGFLNFTGSIGDFLVAIDQALTKGGLLTSFFDGLSSVLKVPLQLLGGIASAIFGLFKGIDSSGADKVAGGLDHVKGAATPLASVLGKLKHAWDGFVHILSQAKDLVSPWLDQIGTQLSKIGDVLAQAFQGDNFDHIMTTLQTGFIGGIFLALKKAITGTSSSFVGILKPMNQALGGLSTNLQAMQQHVKAQVILMIATAIGLLAASTLALSKINADDLAKAMGAISVGLGQLIGGLAILGKIGKGGGFLTLPILAASMVILAASIVVLAAAMKIFSTMSWEELAKGLTGVAGGLTAIGVGMKLLGPGTIVQAPAILVLAIALNALALAVKQFASLDWESLGRGIAGVLGSLIAIMVPLSAAGPELLLGAAAIIPVAFGLTMIAGAIKAFGSMDLGTLAKGIGGAAVALLAIGVALNAVPPHAALLAAGLVVVALALTGIAGAVKIFGSMSVGELAKGLIAMGGALLILAVGLTAMSGTLPGAAALMVAALALAVLGPTLGFLGTLKWSTIFRGLAAIALALGVLAIAGLAAGPGLSALGIALLPLAGVFILSAGAAFLFAKALHLLAGDGTKGIGVMVAAIAAFVALLPKIVIDFVKGLVDIVAEVAKIAPQVTDSLVKILNSLIDVVIRSTPRLATAIGTLVDGILQVIIRDSPKLIRGGFTLVMNLLKGLDNYIPQIIPRVASIVVKFLSGLAAKAPDLTAAGAKFLVAFLSGIAKHISDVVQAGYKIVFGIIDGVVKGIPKLLALGVQAAVGFLNGIANAIPRMIRAGVRIVTSFLDGVSSQFDNVAKAATRFVVRFFQAFGSRENTRKMVDAGFKAAINLLRGIADGIRKDENLAEVIKAAQDIGVAIVEGIGKGLAGLPKKLAGKLLGPLKGGIKMAHGLFESKSPSRVFMRLGQSIIDGLAIGLTSMPGTLDKGILSPFAKVLRETNGLREFGKFLGNEFRDGLTGGLWTDGKSEAQKQIEGAFTALKGKMTEEHKKLREQIKGEEDKLSGLLSDPKKNGAAIDRVRAAIAEDQKTLALSQFRSRSLMAALQDEKSALSKLAVEYEATSKQLEKAKEIFDQYKQQFSQLPDISSLLDTAMSDMAKADEEAAMSGADRWKAIREKQKEDERRHNVDQVANYKKALADQIAATTTYLETLGKLRAAGLDNATYTKLLGMGTAGQEFASQLLAGGPQGIEEINKLDSELAKAAAAIADNAAKELYKAGVDAASGFIKGLEEKQAEIRKMMEFIADSMIGSLKFRLGIRSPSRIFAELGRFSVRGLAEGLKASSNLVRDAATGIGDEAAKALSNSLANISDRVQNSINTDLTITPVLDLTQIQKDASQIQDLTNVTPITAAASYGQAAAISQESLVRDAARADDAQKIIDIHLEQNNTSPKALDDVEIYRQTRNQLSQVKSALGLVS